MANDYQDKNGSGAGDWIYWVISLLALVKLPPVGILMLAGLSAAAAQFAVTSAYRYAPAKELSVYDYSQVLFSAVLGFFLFQQIPDALSWVGYLIIFGTAVLMFLYNNSRPAEG